MVGLACAAPLALLELPFDVAAISGSTWVLATWYALICQRVLSLALVSRLAPRRDLACRPTTAAIPITALAAAVLLLGECRRRLGARRRRSSARRHRARRSGTAADGAAIDLEVNRALAGGREFLDPVGQGRARTPMSVAGYQKSVSLDAYVTGVRDGDRAMLARAITLIREFEGRTCGTGGRATATSRCR